MCQLAKRENKQAPFLHDYYNVHFQFERPLSSVKLVETRLVNSFIDGLNTKERLPKYVVVLMDRDFIDIEDFDFGVRITLEYMIHWIIKEIDKVIYRRKTDLRAKRPGAIAGHGEPRLIFCSILERPRNTHPRHHDIFKLVVKANAVIEKAVSKFSRFCHMLYIESVNEFLHFDYEGKLTECGKIQMWKEIDEQMKMFDKGQIELKPKQNSYNESFNEKSKKENPILNSKFSIIFVAYQI